MTQTSESGIRWHSRGIGVPATRSITERRSRASSDKLRIQQIAGAATAFLFAGLAPALAMAALWPTAEVAPLAFVFTFAIALAHAVCLGLPLFLVFRSKRWINIMSCVVVGFAVGAVPDGVLNWPMQHAGLDASAGAITAAAWVSYLTPVIYCGALGALGGFAFWVARGGSGTTGKAAGAEPRV
jgi:hypothetical protein